MSTTATAATISASRPHKAERPAIAIALSLHRQPALLRSVPRRDIPVDVIEVLRIAAGQEEAIQSASTAFDVTEEALVEAAELYLQLILSNAQSDDMRMLCLPQSAMAADIKDHRRLLLKWLHPDRNHDNWESALFLKVKAASMRLEEQLKAENEKSSIVVPVPTQTSRRRHARHRGGLSRIQQDNTGLFRSAAKPIALVALAMAFAVILLINQMPESPAVKMLISAFSF